MAAPDPPDDALPGKADAPGADGMFGALGTLRLLLVGTIVLPLLLGAVAAFVSYRDSGERAAAALSQAVAVAEENTAKVLDTHLQVAARIDDLLGGLTDDQIRNQEQALHDRIAREIGDLPEVAAAWAIGADGHELVSARVYPVNRAIDQSSREDLGAFRNSNVRTFIWALRARSLNGGNYQPYFTVSRRRDAPDGGFGGAIVVAVSGDYFASFYNSLLGASAPYTASVLREDGTVLEQYPETAGAGPPQADPMLARAIAAGGQSGTIKTGSPLDDAGRIVAFKRLANYPVYVAIERTQASILREWLWSIAGYVVIGVPAAAALIVLSLLALRRTRREQMALARARDAVARHAAAEAQLHQAQRLEAVGLLTAGIAHDFSNLLTVISGNVQVLRASLDGPDAKRQRYLAAALDGCGRASALTKRLLGFARHEPGDPQVVDINDIIVHTLELPWRSGDIAGEFRLNDKLWPVCVDADQLATALLNLMFNARDAMSEGGRLIIETANCDIDAADPEKPTGMAPGQYVGTFVSDTGRGMSEEIRDKVFDPFFTTKEPGKGTGLGLAQVHGFISRSGGYCTIDSEPGRGTTVKLYLPRHVDNGQSETPSHPEPTALAATDNPQRIAPS